MTKPVQRRTSLAARSAVLVAALSLAGVAPLRAQVLTTTAIRPISFGEVLPGVPTTVHPTDPVRSGQFEIIGPSSAAIEITFSLPETLNRTDGASIPIAFGPVSAGYSATGSITSQVLFDPRVPFRTKLSELGRGTSFIGATLTPQGAQRAGSYGVSLSITVALVGL
jgi:hypothetical protein